MGEERKSGEDERVLRGSALTSVFLLFLFFLVNLSIETMTSLAAFTNKARCVRVGARANQRQRVVRVFAEKPVKAEKPVPAKKPAPKKKKKEVEPWVQPTLDPSTPSPIFGGSTGGLLRKAQVEEFYVITWEQEGADLRDAHRRRRHHARGAQPPQAGAQGAVHGPAHGAQDKVQTQRVLLPRLPQRRGPVPPPQGRCLPREGQRRTPAGQHQRQKNRPERQPCQGQVHWISRTFRLGSQKVNTDTDRHNSM